MAYKYPLTIGKLLSATGWAEYPDAPRGVLSGIQDPGAGPGTGLVTFDGVVGIAYIEVIHRLTRRLVASTHSNSDGEWQVADLPSQDSYDVRGVDRSNTYADVYRSDVFPYVE